MPYQATVEAVDTKGEVIETIEVAMGEDPLMDDRKIAKWSSDDFSEETMVEVVHFRVRPEEVEGSEKFDPGPGPQSVRFGDAYKCEFRLVRDVPERIERDDDPDPDEEKDDGDEIETEGPIVSVEDLVKRSLRNAFEQINLGMAEIPTSSKSDYVSENVHFVAAEKFLEVARNSRYLINEIKKPSDDEFKEVTVNLNVKMEEGLRGS